MQSKFKLKKFRTKIFLSFVLVSLLPLFIISYNSLDLVIKTRQVNISELEFLAIENASDKVKKFLNQKMEMFNLVVSATTTDISQIDLNNLNHLIDASSAAAGDIIEISFVDKSGNEIVKRATDENYELLNISGSEEFKKTISGENYFGSVIYTPTGPIIKLASQIENKDRETIGVISATINLNPIKNIINKIRLGSTGFVYLVDGDGSLIASSNDKFASTGANLKNVNLVSDVLGGNFHYGADKEDYYTNSLGQKVIFSGRPTGLVNWYVMSEWPEDDAFSVTQKLILRSGIVILFSLLLIIGFSLIIIRQIVKPIKILNQGAEEISKGNLDQCLNLKTGDEFETLGDSFNKMMEALKENQKLKDEFVFIAAHELRAPVTAIKGYLSMILDKSFGEVPGKIEENLKIINNSNDRLVQLVHDLLEVARSDASRTEIALSDIIVGDNIKAVISELKSLADQKQIKIIYIDTLGNNKVKTDEYKFKEVIANLISNAIKYTPERGEVVISHEIKGDRLITNVQDSGFGISAEDVRKLFTKFFRVKSEKTEKIEGTGLGLFITRMLVEKMKGNIWVESELGKGSIFSFSLLLA